MADWKRNSTEDQSSSTQSKGSNTTVWILSTLLAIAVITTVYFGIQSSNLSDQSDDLATQLDQTRTDLEGQLGELETSYNDQVAENDTLSAEIQTKVQEVEELQGKIANMRSQLASSKANAKEIKAKLAQLEALKTDLETEITGLTDQNEQLATANFALNEELITTKGEVNKLNAQVAELTSSNEAMNQRLTTLAPAGYRADNFRIAIQKRNDKLTSKARKADEVIVSFNLDNVPADRHGDDEIYLAVTTIAGNPVAQIPTKQVNISTKSAPIKIDAADAKKVSLESNQRLDMSFKMEDDLDAGEYNLVVYSNKGYLGSTGFRLR